MGSSENAVIEFHFQLPCSYGSDSCITRNRLSSVKLHKTQQFVLLPYLQMVRSYAAGIFAKDKLQRGPRSLAFCFGSAPEEPRNPVVLGWRNSAAGSSAARNPVKAIRCGSTGRAPSNQRETVLIDAQRPRNVRLSYMPVACPLRT